MTTITTAYNRVTDSCCAKVVEAIALIDSQTSVLKPVGSITALRSQQNVGGFTLKVDPNKDRPTNGSFRKVYTEDIAPECNKDTTADAACAAPVFTPVAVPADGYNYAEHRVDLSIKREIILNVDQFKQFCKTPQTYLADRLIAMRSGVWTEMNTKAIARLVAYMGAYPWQTSPHTSISDPMAVSFLTPNSAGGFMFDPTGYSKIKDQYAKLGWAYEPPIVVGGSQLSVFQSNSAFMGGANVNGVDSAAVPNLYADYGVDVAFNDGAQHLLTWKPGTFQLVSHNDVSDDMVRLSARNVRERSRVDSPFGDGLTWDFYYDVDPGGCIYKLKWQLWYDVIQPVPYSGACALKPALAFLTGCTANTCPTSGYSGGVGLG